MPIECICQGWYSITGEGFCHSHTCSTSSLCFTLASTHPFSNLVYLQNWCRIFVVFAAQLHANCVPVNRALPLWPYCQIGSKGPQGVSRCPGRSDEDRLGSVLDVAVMAVACLSVVAAQYLRHVAGTVRMGYPMALESHRTQGDCRGRNKTVLKEI